MAGCELDAVNPLPGISVAPVGVLVEVTGREIAQAVGCEVAELEAKVFGEERPDHVIGHGVLLAFFDDGPSRSRLQATDGEHEVPVPPVISV